MKNYLKHIDDFFREKLGRYSEKPPADVWESLEARLDTLAPPASTPQGPGIWTTLKHFGIVSLITAASVFVIKNITYKNNSAAGKEIAKTENAVSAAAPEVTSVAPTQATEQAKATASTSEQPASDAGAAPADTKAAEAASSAGNTTAPHTAGQKMKTASPKLSAHDHKAQSSPAKASEAAYAYNKPRKTAGTANNENLSKPGPVEDNEEAETPENSYPASAGKTIKNDKPENKTKVKDEPKDDHRDNKQQEKVKKPEHNSNWSIGVKAGYERGFNDLAATKYAVSPYLQYKLSGKVALMVQPAVKYATEKENSIGKPSSYYNVNNDGTATQNGASLITPIVVGGTVVQQLYTTTYTYRQSHDSVAKTYSHGGSYTEIELPLLVSYSVLPQLSVYGGIDLVYSRQTAVTEHTYTKAAIVKSMDSTTTTAGAATPLAVSDVIQYNGSSYSEYKSPVYSNTQSSSIRPGYMIGVSYEYSNRWMVDAMMQQTPVKPYVQGGYNINSTLSAPYFRLSLGYRLTK